MESNSTWDSITFNMNANGYRLPTESEWEYAAKGGNQSNGYTYSGSNSIDDVAWYRDNNGNLHEGKKKAANELGLFDMSGNLWEWCWDWYSSSYSSDSVTNPCGASSGMYRVFRGGSCGNDAPSSRTALRMDISPEYCDASIGFRIVRSAQ